LTKFLQVGLSLPSLTHLTLVDVASRGDPIIDPWPEFTATSVSDRLTTLEVLHCSSENFPSLRSLRSLRTLKLHRTAALKSFTPIIDNTPTVVVPPGLKEVHYFDSDIEGETISNVLSRIREEEGYKEWSCGIRFSGCRNIKLNTLLVLRDHHGVTLI